VTTKEKLIDSLRFGPMAQVMRGWDEQQRMWLCATMADALLADGWTRTPEESAQ
jgi:hypothetical protein